MPKLRESSKSSNEKSRKQRSYSISIKVRDSVIKFRSKDLKITSLDEAVEQNTELHSYYNYYLQIAKADYTKEQDSLEDLTARTARGHRRQLDEDGDECNNAIITELLNSTVRLRKKIEKVREHQHNVDLLKMVVSAYDSRKTAIIQKVQLLRHSNSLGFK